MALKWYSLVIDCHDLAAQARWWADVLDWKLVYEDADEAVLVPQHVDDDRRLTPSEWAETGPVLCFVSVPESKDLKNRLHIDLAPHLSDDREEQIERLIAKGATRVHVGQDADQVSWTVLADPEDNEFCVLSSRDR